MLGKTRRCLVPLIFILLSSTTSLHRGQQPSSFASAFQPLPFVNISKQKPFVTMSSVNNDPNDNNSGLLISVMQHVGDSVQLVLASQSPRRREILDMMGLAGKYRAEPSPLNEEVLQTDLSAEVKSGAISFKDYSQRLAEAKAEALAAEQRNDCTAPTLYLGSDTIVEWQEQILEKPKSIDQAKEMLSKLSGEEHRVHTAVALYRVLPVVATEEENEARMDLIDSFVDTANVRFTTLSSMDIDSYVGTGDPMDKAGSYGIQSIGGQMVEEVRGDFFTVMGLPMHRTSKALAKAIRNQLKTRIELN